MIRNRRKFLLGVLGLVSFAGALAAWLSPVAGGRTGLRWADDFFSRLSKYSSDHIHEVEKQSAGFKGRTFEATVRLKSPEDAAKLAKILAASGAAEAAADGAGLKVKGDLGGLALAAIADADLLFHERGAELETKYGQEPREAVYLWWLAFGDIYRHYLRAGDIGASNFASEIRTKACEPAYNFAGIPAMPASQAWLPLALLLVFYLVFTAWYGFSIMWVFEGLGITARGGKKREA